MSDSRQQQQSAAPVAAATTTANPQAQQQAAPAVARVQAMLASGRRELAAIAAIVQSEPSAQAAVMALLHQTMGNRFVHAVLELIAPGLAPTAAPAETGASDGPVRVTANGLHVRRTPSTASSENIVGNLHHGAIVTAVGHEGEWAKIEHGGTPAFVHGHYVEPVVKKPASDTHASPGEHAHHEPAASAAPAPSETGHAPSSAHIAPAHDVAAPVAAPAQAATGAPAHTPAHAHHDAPAQAAPAATAGSSVAAAKPGEPISVGDDKVKPIFGKHGSGYSKYGGGTVKAALTTLVESGRLHLTGAQIAQLDAIAQVETGGQIACVQTYDNQKISMGFKQVVLGYGSLEKLMLKAPAGFAKHGLSLDMSAVYTDVKGGTPHQITGAPESEMLRSEDWGNKFYAASQESDVIAAMCDLVLADARKVDTTIKKSGGGIANFDDATARAWLLEVQNNRPAFVPFVVKQAVSDGAKDAGTRDEFLDVLSRAIIKTYEVEEPAFAFKSAKASKKHKDDTPAQLEALHKELIATLGPEGIKKGTNIVTKISRHIEIPTVKQGETVAAASPALAPAPTAAIEHHVSAPTPEHDAPHVAPAAPAVHPETHAAQPAHPSAAAPAVTPVVAPPTTAAHSEIPAHPDAQVAAAPAPHAAAPAPHAAAPAPHAAAPAPHAAAPAPHAATAAPATPARNPNEMYEHVYTAGSGDNTQEVAVFVSPGVTATPNLFIFLHGYDAQMQIDSDADHKGKAGVLSGIDVAAETTKVARNTITLVPQGVIGRAGDRKTHEGGYMKAIASNGLEAFLNSLLPSVARDIGQIALTPAHIGLAGHSAGGYKGIQESLGSAGGLADTISDVTLMDTDYSPTHFETTAQWLLKKPAAGKDATTKTLRISESDYQMKDAAKKGIHGAVQTFGEAVFKPRAEKAGYTFVHMAAGNDQGAHNTALARYQLHLDGKVHADVLLMQSDRGPGGHHQVRDDIMDDSILSVGQGAAATEGFGDKVIAGHGAKSIDGLHAGGVASTAPAATRGASPAKPQQPVAKPVTEADLHGEVAKARAVHAPRSDQAAQAPHAGAVDPSHEMPTDEAHGLAGPKVAAGIVDDNKTTKPVAPPVQTTAGPSGYLHDTNDATAAMTPKTKELYDKAIATLRAGNLIFPSEHEVAPKTSEPFKKFVASLYGQFGMNEKRINLDIIRHGGESTYSMKAYVESVLSPLPSETVAPGHSPQRMHHKMLDAFLKMREAAAGDNVQLLAISCFRPGKANATSSNHFAVATNSSHGYGLAVDLQLSVDASRTADGKKFSVSEVNTHDAGNLMKYYQSSVMKWMAMNGMKFDFHPYYNEPWHFEYNPDGMAADMVAGAKAWKASHANNA